MQKDLEGTIGKSFWSSLFGGPWNATAPGQIDRQIDIVKKLKIKLPSNGHGTRIVKEKI